MAKRMRNTEDDELEKLREENRSLKATIRSLQKALKKLSKGKDRLEDLEDLVQEMALEAAPKVKEDTSNKCPSCHKSKLSILELGPKKLITCAQCGYRQLAGAGGRHG